MNEAAAAATAKKTREKKRNNENTLNDSKQLKSSRLFTRSMIGTATAGI